MFQTPCSSQAIFCYWFCFRHRVVHIPYLLLDLFPTPCSSHTIFCTWFCFRHRVVQMPYSALGFVSDTVQFKCHILHLVLFQTPCSSQIVFNITEDEIAVNLEVITDDLNPVTFLSLGVTARLQLTIINYNFDSEYEIPFDISTIRSCRCPMVSDLCHFVFSLWRGEITKTRSRPKNEITTASYATQQKTRIETLSSFCRLFRNNLTSFRYFVFSSEKTTKCFVISLRCNEMAQ